MSKRSDGKYEEGKWQRRQGRIPEDFMSSPQNRSGTEGIEVEGKEKGEELGLDYTQRVN